MGKSNLKLAESNSEYFRQEAIKRLKFQINRHNLPGEHYSQDAGEIVDFIMLAVSQDIKATLIKEGLIKETV